MGARVDPWDGLAHSFVATVWDVLTWIQAHGFLDRAAWTHGLVPSLSPEAASKAWERLPERLARVGAPIRVDVEDTRGRVLRATEPPVLWLTECVPERFDVSFCSHDTGVTPEEFESRLAGVRAERARRENRMLAARRFQRVFEERADPRRFWPTT